MPMLRLRLLRTASVVCILMACVSSAGAQSTFHDITVSYTYPGTYRTIRQADFRNLTLHKFDENGPDEGVQLTNGKFKAEFQNGVGESVSIDSIYFLPPSPGTQAQYALVLSEWESVGGSSSQWGIAQVFELSGDRLSVVQQVDWDWHYGGPYEPFKRLFETKTNTITFPSAHYLPGDAHCCVSAIDIVTMRWNGSRFLQTKIRTELSGYGKRQGKTLDHSKDLSP